MYNPTATYRLQFNKDFRLEQLEQIIPYLKSIGIRCIYASPVLESVRGSRHGYDLLNASHIDPEIGTETAFRNIVQQLKQQGIGWIQDIVPNHMAYHQHNHWLMDVLEKGKDSVYVSCFDTALNDPYFEGPIMAPFLGTSAATAIQQQQIQITYHNRRLTLCYNEIYFPLQAWCYKALLESAQQPAAIQSLLAAMPVTADISSYAANWERWLDQLSALYNDHETNTYLTHCIRKANTDSEIIAFYAGAQHYRLCSWEETDKSINYRRFFTVNELICLRQENQETFDLTHNYISDLLSEGLIDGLRVDHVDGLYDPYRYLLQLRALAGNNCYIITEKILAQQELLPASWPVQGNTGYDFLAAVNEVLINGSTQKAFDHFYRELVPETTDIATQVLKKKKYILYRHMAGELDNLCRLFSRLIPEAANTTGQEMIRETIAALLIYCPVYRYYGNRFPLNEKETAAIRLLIDTIKTARPELSAGLALLDIALLRQPHNNDRDYNSRVLHFYRRCMQLSGPLMAKGVEDTFLYTYSRYIGQNEVGDHLGQWGLSVTDFHRKMIARIRQAPLSLNATATHDTKRGEDARARLTVLTDIPEQWISQVTAWQQLNAPAKTNGCPDTADEYLIYQSLVAAYPMPGQESESFAGRFKSYLLKALREGKRHSEWAAPDDEYESGTLAFADYLLRPGGKFLDSLKAFLQDITDAGIIQSLSQLILKCTCPGIPDIYQGTELWDLSFVDPDNRRNVDFGWRGQLLEDLRAIPAADFSRQLWQRRYDGSIKLWLLQALLQLRQQEQELFTSGRYIPVQATGRYKDHLLSFLRRSHNTWILVVVPLHIAALCKDQHCSVPDIDWSDTGLLLPEDIPGSWNQLHSSRNDIIPGPGNILAIKTLFREWPFAVAVNKQKDTGRRAGILLPVSALPSAFGIGDLGPAARSFVDFLYKSDQTLWQLLPLNPIDASTCYSPYDTISGMAGNTLLISPEWLAEAGLLPAEKLAVHKVTARRAVNYPAVVKAKKRLFQKAYDTFRQGGFPSLEAQFLNFCNQEAYWLDDYAGYMALRQAFNNTDWHLWPEPYKYRDKKALTAFYQLNQDDINQNKWLQFIFELQWTALRQDCRQAGVQLFGDLPFYVSYGSADVWSNQVLFNLDPSGNIKGMAGVPPDYFSKDGQLWGMPTFNWEAHKAQGYKWWLQRMARNLAFFDLLRIDHFRAFAAYWEVPAGEKTARNGRWITGPGKDFFDTAGHHFKKLPFVAEDLGIDMNATYALRDALGLPGMKVLQFAFDSNMPYTPDIPHHYPHNCVVYTGTHDNNTTKGWYRSESGRGNKERIRAYTGIPVKYADIATVLTRIAYNSVARTVVIPIQDLLALGADARMNTPGTAEGNWRWRLKPEQLTKDLQQYIKNLVRIYDRR